MEVGLKRKTGTTTYIPGEWIWCLNMQDARVSGLTSLEVVSPPLADLSLLLFSFTPLVLCNTSIPSVPEMTHSSICLGFPPSLYLFHLPADCGQPFVGHWRPQSVHPGPHFTLVTHFLSPLKVAVACSRRLFVFSSMSHPCRRLQRRPFLPLHAAAAAAEKPHTCSLLVFRRCALFPKVISLQNPHIAPSLYCPQDKFSSSQSAQQTQ